MAFSQASISYLGSRDQQVTAIEIVISKEVDFKKSFESLWKAPKQKKKTKFVVHYTTYLYNTYSFVQQWGILIPHHTIRPSQHQKNDQNQICAINVGLDSKSNICSWPDYFENNTKTNTWISLQS